MAATVACMSPAEMVEGNTDESMTRRPPTLCTRSSSSTAAVHGEVDDDDGVDEEEEEDGPMDTLPIQLLCGNAFRRI